MHDWPVGAMGQAPGQRDDLEVFLELRRVVAFLRRLKKADLGVVDGADPGEPETSLRE